MSKLSQYKVNENYFEKINNEKKAYFLGLFAADGCNYVTDKNTRCFISLQEMDKEILEILNKEIFPDGDRSLLYNNKRASSGPQWKFEVFNKKISNDLINHGITPRKSLSLKFPVTIPSKYIRHFIRGYFDGDGCISSFSGKNRKTPKYRISILSTKEFLIQLQQYILNINSKIKLRGKIHELCIGGNNQVKKFCDFIYNGSELYLKRKYNRYCELNNALKVLQRRTSSKYRGISYSKYMKKWLAYFSLHKKPQLKVGWFNTEIEAYNARNAFKLPPQYAHLEYTKKKKSYQN